MPIGIFTPLTVVMIVCHRRGRNPLLEDAEVGLAKCRHAGQHGSSLRRSARDGVCVVIARPNGAYSTAAK